MTKTMSSLINLPEFMYMKFLPRMEAFFKMSKSLFKKHPERSVTGMFCNCACAGACVCVSIVGHRVESLKHTCRV